MRNLSLNCIEAVKKSSPKHGVYYTYELTDISEIPFGVTRPNNNYKMRSFKLGEDYSPSSIKKRIEDNVSVSKSVADDGEILSKMSHTQQYEKKATTVQNIIEVPVQEEPSYVPDVVQILNDRDEDEEENSVQKKKAAPSSQSSMKTVKSTQEKPAQLHCKPAKWLMAVQTSRKGKKSPPITKNTERYYKGMNLKAYAEQLNKNDYEHDK